MREKLYRKEDGQIILNGIKSVGINNALSFPDVYGWPSNGFPEGQPQNIVEETIWAGIQWEKIKTAS